MRHAQLILLDSDDRLAAPLRAAALRRRWAFRAPKRPGAWARHLTPGGSAVLVLRVGRDVVEELGVLANAVRWFPEVPVVAALDSAEPALAELAWDLGATYVGARTGEGPALAEVVAAILERLSTPAPPGTRRADE